MVSITFWDNFYNKSEVGPSDSTSLVGFGRLVVYLQKPYMNRPTVVNR